MMVIKFCVTDLISSGCISGQQWFQRFDNIDLKQFRNYNEKLKKKLEKTYDVHYQVLKIKKPF